MKLVGLIAAILVGIWFLDSQFPGALASDDTKFGLFHSVLIVVFIAGGALFARQIPLTQAAKHALVWLVALLVLVLGYSYRDVLLDSRIGAELLPGRARMQADGSLVLQRGEGGHFFAYAEVNGARIRFLVDTGATEIVLGPEDAKRAGYDIGALNYSLATQTANGAGAAARIRITNLQVGAVELHDIPAMVNRAEMGGSLLGMRFLNQFRTYHVQGNSLTLVP